jgi:hypothetical protein
MDKISKILDGTFKVSYNSDSRLKKLKKKYGTSVTISGVHHGNVLTTYPPYRQAQRLNLMAS